MPKKPQSLKEQPLKKKPIGMEKSALERAMSLIEKGFQNAHEKNGFELYQLFRDSIVEALSQEDSRNSFIEAKESMPTTHLMELDLIEKGYMANILACFTVKFSSPEMYPVLLPIFDQYIKPKLQRQGASLFRENMAGLFVYLYSGQNRASIRQASNIATQLFDINSTYLEEAYRRVSNKKPSLEIIISEDAILLIALLATVKFFERNISKISSITPDDVRSRNDLDFTLGSIRARNREILDAHLAPVKDHIEANPDSVVAQFIEERGLDTSDTASSFSSALYVVGAKFFISYLPHTSSQEAASFSEEVTQSNLK